MHCWWSILERIQRTKFKFSMLIQLCTLVLYPDTRTFQALRVVSFSTKFRRTAQAGNLLFAARDAPFPHGRLPTHQVMVTIAFVL